jgi:phosphoglycerate kinase
MNTLLDLDLSNRRVLLRVDLNTPIQDYKISDDERIIRSLPTIRYILENNGKLTVLSHLGRPEENGVIQVKYSLNPVAQRLGDLLGLKVNLFDSIEEWSEPDSGNLNMIENVRFLKGEKSNDPLLSKKLAEICDIFVMDAFATSHRAHASTTGVISYAKEACAGLLLREELESLGKLNHNANRPSVAVLGGAKISTKLDLINSLSDKMDYVILGGGIANTCLAAQGFEVGSSLCEKDMLKQALELANKKGVILPKKVVVAGSLEEEGRIVDVDSVKSSDSIFDIAPESFEAVKSILSNAKVILWNGPVGLFEKPQFMHGTSCVANMIVNSGAYSVGGGGDTIAAAKEIGVLDDIDYMSTAGGAFLEFIEGRPLPAIVALELKALESQDNRT